MRDDARLRRAPGPAGDARGLAILDRGGVAIAPAAYAAAIRSILDGKVDELARDRNSICYRVALVAADGAPVMAVVKVPREGPQRTNPDASFAGEAAILARLPQAGIDCATRLLARVGVAGGHFLFTTELPGSHPDPRRHPLDPPRLAAILDSLSVLERQGLMHYDLKAANILVTAERAAFIDFEFSRFGDCGPAPAPAPPAWCEDFNVSGNPHLPARSNVANFEFRCLHRYLVELAAEDSPATAGALLDEYLRARSRFHARMACVLDGLPAARRPEAAIAHERMLAAALAAPTALLARVERAVMDYRCHVFERREAEARAVCRATLAELDADVAGARTLPEGYAPAARRIFALVARSVHPPA